VELFVVEDFFETLGVDGKRLVRERTNALVRLLEEWAPQYPFIRTIRIPSVALLIATVVPQMALTDSFLVTKLIMLIFGIDDMADEREITLAQLRPKAKQWHSIADQGASSRIDEDDHLAQVLLEVREHVSRFPLFDPLREYWSCSVRRLIEAMAREYQYGLRYSAGGACALPTLHECVYCGVYSLGFPLWASTVLILLNESSTVEHLESIDRAIKCAGGAIRLCNDLRTLDKEIQENNINSVVILYHTMLNRTPSATRESALSEAKQHVLQMAKSYAQRCRDLVGQNQSEHTRFGEALCRIVDFSMYFYVTSGQDYHIPRLAEINQLLETADLE
jgi:hypothetical protein